MWPLRDVSLFNFLDDFLAMEAAFLRNMRESSPGIFDPLAAKKKEREYEDRMSRKARRIEHKLDRERRRV